MTILYVEDNLVLAKSVRSKLRHRFNLEIAGTVSEAFRKIISRDYSLVITDYFLPDLTGLDLCKMIRDEKIDIPILFLTVNDNKKNIVEALDSGADDYLSKPFDFAELEARIRVLLKRRTYAQFSKDLETNFIKLHSQTRKIECTGKIFKIPRQEYILLEFFILNSGRLISRREIYENVWGSDDYYNSNTIDVHVRRLRERLRQHTGKNHIKSVYGMGYRFVAE